MEQKIKEVENYFRKKLIEGEFELLKVDEYNMEVSIDGYIFNLWVSNYNLPKTYKLSETRPSYINLKLNDEDSLKLHNLIYSQVMQYRSKILIEKKKAEIERLELELENELNNKLWQ
jgi:hypothetical protein